MNGLVRASPTGARRAEVATRAKQEENDAMVGVIYYCVFIYISNMIGSHLHDMMKERTFLKICL